MFVVIFYKTSNKTKTYYKDFCNFNKNLKSYEYLKIAALLHWQTEILKSMKPLNVFDNVP